MAREFTKLKPELHVRDRFRALSDQAKLLYYTYLGSPHQNSCGCARFSPAYIDDDLNWTGTSRYSDAQAELVGNHFIAADPATREVFILDWFESNPPMNDKHLTGIRKQIEKIISEELRAHVNEALQKCLAARASPHAMLQDRKTAVEMMSRLPKRN